MLEPLEKAGKAAVIPPKGNRKEPRAYDRELYKARHLIENFFAKLKQFRAIATRYDKRAVNFLGAIHLAAAVIWLNGGQALRHGFQNALMRFAMMKMQAAVRRARITRPSRS